MTKEQIHRLIKKIRTRRDYYQMQKSLQIVADVLENLVDEDRKGEQGLQGIQGERGEKGDQGEKGATIYTSRDIANHQSVPNPKEGDIFIYITTNGTFWQYQNNAWVWKGTIKGPKGDKGDNGTIEIKNANGDDNYQDILFINEKGEIGKKDSYAHIEWIVWKDIERTVPTSFDYENKVGEYYESCKGGEHTYIITRTDELVGIKLSDFVDFIVDKAIDLTLREVRR